MKKNQKGFSIVEILIIIAVVGLIGGVGWYVWQSRQDAKSTVNNPSSTINEQQKSPTGNSANAIISPPTVNGAFSVPELGIKIINVPSSLSDMNYAVNVYGSPPDGFTAAYFSTETLSKLDNGCSPTGHVSQNGSMAKRSGTYDPDDESLDGDGFVKQFNGFWISYGHPQSICSEDTKTEDLHIVQTKAFMDLVNNPANIEAL